MKQENGRLFKMATFGDFRNFGTSIFTTGLIMLGELILWSTEKVIYPIIFRLKLN